MQNTKGFSLLEVLVAFSLMAITLAVILQAWAGTLRGAARAEQRLAAVSLAESLLARSGRENALQVGDTRGSLDGMDWTLSVTPAGQEGPLEEPPSRLYVITAAVAWGDERKPQTVALTSLRTQMPQRQRSRR